MLCAPKDVPGPVSTSQGHQEEKDILLVDCSTLGPFSAVASQDWRDSDQGSPRVEGPQQSERPWLLLLVSQISSSSYVLSGRMLGFRALCEVTCG